MSRTAEKRAEGEAEIGLERDPFGGLTLRLPGGERMANVTPVRSFPFTAPESWIAFLDAEGREVFCLRELSQLDAQTREQLERELAAREFIPVVRRIVSVEPDSEPSVWRVETDRGEVQFTVLSEDHLRRLEPDGVLIADSHGIRYRVMDRRALDAQSRKLLDRYL